MSDEVADERSWAARRERRRRLLRVLRAGLWTAMFVVQVAHPNTVGDWIGWAIASGCIAVAADRMFTRFAAITPVPVLAPTSERTLGLPYVVQLIDSRRQAQHHHVTISAEAITLKPWICGEWRESDTRRISLAGVSSVHAGATSVDIQCLEGTRRVTLVIRVTGYADRSRLLWELAVRVPEAVECGIESAAPRSSSTASLRPLLSAPRPARDDEFPRAPSGLASSLTPPAASPPAPPRSALGCGLFAAPSLYAAKPKPD